jgi:hypothetical protein
MSYVEIASFLAMTWWGIGWVALRIEANTGRVAKACVV